MTLVLAHAGHWLVSLSYFAPVIGFLIWLATRDTEVPTQRIEQDVTNEALAH